MDAMGDPCALAQLVADSFVVRVPALRLRCSPVHSDLNVLCTLTSRIPSRAAVAPRASRIWFSWTVIQLSISESDSGRVLAATCVPFYIQVQRTVTGTYY